MKLSNLSGTNGGQAVLQIEAGSEGGFSPKIQLLQDSTIRTYLQYDKANDNFFILAPTGSVHLLAYNNTASFEVNNQNVEIKIDNNTKVKVQSNQVNINTDLKLNQNTLDFTSVGNHYMEFDDGTMDGILLSAFGFGDKPFFRANCSDGNGTVFELFKEKVIIYKQLVFNAGNNDTANIIYDTSNNLNFNIVETGEFRINKGADGTNYFKTIKQGGGANGRTFFFEQGGDNNTSNGGSFQTQCSQGKMVFQGDRNLVIYRPAGETPTVAFASDSSASSLSLIHI